MVGPCCRWALSVAEIPLVMFSLLCAYVTHSVLLGCFCLGAVARPSMPGRLMELSQRVGKAVAGV